FAEAIDELCQKECGTREQRDALTRNGTEAHNAEFYAKLAGLGWLGIGLPEADSGSGGGITERSPPSPPAGCTRSRCPNREPVPTSVP
ncbi:MAG: acyl-CoA dehydrogenase family protein, partial [Pseudonocardiaceae bacterium]